MAVQHRSYLLTHVRHPNMIVQSGIDRLGEIVSEYLDGCKGSEAL